jgi:cysteine synthase
LPITNADAFKCSLDLAQKEGIFCGITSGATFAAALQVAASAPKGSTILVFLTDTGERYLSTPLFASIGADMNADELEISKSTAGFQMQAAT